MTYVCMTAQEAVDHFAALSSGHRLEVTMLSWDDDEGEYMPEESVVLSDARIVTRTTKIGDRSFVHKMAVFSGVNIVSTCDARDLVRIRIN